MRTLLLLVLTTLTACADDSEQVNIRLTMAEREMVDKKIRNHMDSIRPILEADCDKHFDDRVALATDSIVQRLLEEEARLRARIPQNQRR